jgi:hypothetical protein
MSSDYNKQEINDTLLHAAEALKRLRDNSFLTEEQYLSRIDLLVGAPTVIEAEVVVKRISFADLMDRLDNFVIHEIQEIWTKWSASTTDTSPFNLFGSEYMVEVYGKMMLKEMLPRILKPPEEETNQLKIYTETILPYFKGKRNEYRSISRKHQNDLRTLYGIESENATKLLEISMAIQDAGGSEYADKKDLRKESALKETGTKLRNARMATRRYYRRNAIWYSYLEIMGMDISTVRPSDFQIFQAYISRNYEIFKGEPYSNTTWNDYRTRCSFVWNYMSREKILPIEKDVIADVPVLEAKSLDLVYPVDAFPLSLDRNWTILPKKDEVLKVYTCLKTTKHSRIKKNRALLTIIFRLFRETGLRYEHISLLRWGRLPKKEDKPHTRVKGRRVYKIDYINFEEEAARLRKDVPRDYGLISELLAKLIFKYREEHPDLTHDDYYVLSGKVLFNWSDAVGGYRTSTLNAIDPETGRKRHTNAFHTCIAWMREACGDKVRVAPSRFRDSFMTLTLEALPASAVMFKDITGDLITTAMKHYRAPAQYISLPEKGGLSYPQIVALIFDKERV